MKTEESNIIGRLRHTFRTLCTTQQPTRSSRRLERWMQAVPELIKAQEWEWRYTDATFPMA